MARIDELLAQVTDDKLRGDLVSAVSGLRRRKKFGLVYEEHVPETVLLGAEVGVRPGIEVTLRTKPADRRRFSVEKVAKTKVTIVAGDDRLVVDVADLLVVRPFGEPAYPVLRTTDAVVRDPAKAFHAVINGENFHALQLLLFGYEGKVDCVYIDPPYNTGDRSWKYNNDFVDGNDEWSHSRWLSMMEKRLRLTGKLLAPNGVLIVTIDEHEVSHLALLLADVFRGVRQQMVTIVNNTAGSQRPSGFSRAEEYAFFCFFGDARPNPMYDDLLAEDSGGAGTQYWFPLTRGRGIDDRPAKRPNMVYPIAIDPKTNRVVATGRSVKDRVAAGEITGDMNSWVPDQTETIEGFPVIWPLLSGGVMSRWQLNAESLLKLHAEGFVRVRPSSSTTKANAWTIAYVKDGNRKKVQAGEIEIVGREGADEAGALVLGSSRGKVIPKTVWKRATHDARIYGSSMLRSLIGDSSFNYPKSPYAVRDTLASVIAGKPDAVVLDFFAGSGTTLQSLAMLNAEDGGSRRCILVTNNEVSEAEATQLNAAGLFRGDPAYEEHGICRSVTEPRLRAALSGVRADGSPVDGEYVDGGPLSEGFSENAMFFDLVYENPDRLDVGDRLREVLPTLWLCAGAVGDPSGLEEQSNWLLCEGYVFAVLLDEDHFADFSLALGEHPDVTHVWLVTDSEAAFARMRDQLPSTLDVGMLYRDYLRNFRVNTAHR